MKPRLIAYVSALFFVLSFQAQAATYTTSLYSEFQTDEIYLFIVNDAVDPFIRFDTDPVVFGRDATSWSSALYDDNTTLRMQGPTIDPNRGEFSITFEDHLPSGSSDSFDFTLEWAELLNGTVLDQGSIYYVDGAYSYHDANFTSAIPNPVPASVWMLGTGLALLLGLRRRRA